MSHEQIVRIMCPSLKCRKVLAVPVSSRGKNVRCKNCGAMIKVPEKQANVPIAPVAKEDDKQVKKPAA